MYNDPKIERKVERLQKENRRLKVKLEKMNNNFNVQVCKTNDSPSRPISLRVTHNGYQWSALNVTRAELIKVKEAINEYLKADKK